MKEDLNIMKTWPRYRNVSDVLWHSSRIATDLTARVLPRS
jgi:hypothetical protein